MTRRGSIHLAIITSLLLGVLMLTGCTGRTPAESTPTPISVAVPRLVPAAMPGEDDIIVYPGATDVEKFEENAPLGRSIYFVTPDSLDQVYDFYKSTYIGKGWRVNERRITFQDADFIWADDEGAVPWNVGLGLDFYNDAPGGRRYVVWVERQPDPDNIPVIEGAADVSVVPADMLRSIEGLEDLTGGPKRVVTYTTTLIPTEILESYKYHMESYGWNVGESTSDQARFGYSYGVPEKMYINSALVRAIRGSEGKTLVTVGATGADAHVLYEGEYNPPIASVARAAAPPPAVPKYPGAKSTAVHDPTSWRTRLFGLQTMDAWTSQDSPEQVRKFYEDTLSSQGWKQVDHHRPNWYRFTYETGASCQSRHSTYLVITPQAGGTTHLLVMTYIGCYVISGDE